MPKEKFGIKELRDGLTLEEIENRFPWILQADIKNAVIGKKGDKLVWYDGIWENGIWVDGIWMDGLWIDGVWIEGEWLQSDSWQEGWSESGRPEGYSWKREWIERERKRLEDGGWEKGWREIEELDDEY